MSRNAMRDMTRRMSKGKGNMRASCVERRMEGGWVGCVERFYAWKGGRELMQDMGGYVSGA